MVTKLAAAKPKKGMLIAMNASPAETPRTRPSAAPRGKSVATDQTTTATETKASETARPQQQHNARAHHDQGGDKRKQAAVRT